MKNPGQIVLRTTLGLIFVAHGYPKLFGGEGKGQQVPEPAKKWLGDNFVGSMEHGGIDQTAGWLESMQIPNPRFSAWAIGLTEFGGGLALVTGVFARAAAPVIIFSQLVAIRKIHFKQGLIGGFEMNLSLIAGLLAIALRDIDKTCK